MLAKIDINKLNSGRIEIAVCQANESRGSIQTYPSHDEAKKVLLNLGIPSATIEDQLGLLSEIGPRELLYFAPLEVAEDTLHAHGFLP